ncbi:MAG: hypothetical protein AB7E47_02175 [Desulfovibrionaceae bacterium]
MAIIRKNTAALPVAPTKKRSDTAHAALVERGLRWLRNRCSVAFAELVTIAGEIPDGWGYSADGSILVECKATRSDFLADAKKIYRRLPEKGMGNHRYFLCPPDLIKPEELPASWGLLYCYPKQIKVVVKAKSQPANLVAERTLLVSLVRRCALRWDITDVQKMEASA